MALSNSWLVEEMGVFEYKERESSLKRCKAHGDGDFFNVAWLERPDKEA